MHSGKRRQARRSPASGTVGARQKHEGCPGDAARVSVGWLGGLLHPAAPSVRSTLPTRLSRTQPHSAALSRTQPHSAALSYCLPQSATVGRSRPQTTALMDTLRCRTKAPLWLCYIECYHSSGSWSVWLSVVECGCAAVGHVYTLLQSTTVSDTLLHYFTLHRSQPTSAGRVSTTHTTSHLLSPMSVYRAAASNCYLRGTLHFYFAAPA